MAIVEMKHIDMLALEKDKTPLLREIQKIGCFHLIPSNDESIAFSKMNVDSQLSDIGNKISSIQWAIGKLNKYDTEKKPFLSDKKTISMQQAQQLLSDYDKYQGVIQNLEQLESEAGEIRSKIAKAEVEIEQLEQWIDLSANPSEIIDTKNTISMLGTVNKNSLEQYNIDNDKNDLFNISYVSTQRDLANVVVLYHASCENYAKEKLNQMGFSKVELPKIETSVKEKIEQLNANLLQYEKDNDGLSKEVEKLAVNLNSLRQLYDLLNSQNERLQATRNFSASEKTFFLQGWVPENMTNAIKQRLAKISPSVSIEFYDAQENEEPPVLLQNSPIFVPFESVVAGYSLPSPGGIDPTTIMMPFFVNFMGMMISDAGYGLMMAVLLPIMIKLFKPAPNTKKLMWLLAAGGVATLFWGAMYNSWFGFSPWPTVFDPMNNAIPVMGVCIGLGAVHLFAGLAVGAYMNIKRGKIVDAIADQLSWFLLIVGLALLLVAPSIGKWIAIAGVVIILTTSGREKSKNPFKRLLSGLGALYGITSWVSDLLSYMRLFGMGLATGVIGMVINILVGMVFSNGVIGWIFGIGLFVGGHMFNLAINTLGAYVHSCRLQYIEFFGKFYEDGGKPFKPLTQNSRYFYINEA